MSRGPERQTISVDELEGKAHLLAALSQLDVISLMSVTFALSRTVASEIEQNLATCCEHHRQHDLKLAGAARQIEAILASAAGISPRRHS